MQTINIENITVDKIPISTLYQKNVSLSILRLDKIHPVISGNKWFKLKYYLQEAKQENKNTIVTFGGAWSNHILATAGVCAINNLKSIGLIRGEEPKNPSSTLIQANKLGMKLIFLNRQEYKQKIIPAIAKGPDNYFINEGGYGEKGAIGAADILDSCKIDGYTHICCTAGTGTMAAGLIKKISPEQKLVTISVLKNYFDLREKINEIAVNDLANLIINHDYHFGGYAKFTTELIQFMNEFYGQTAIPTDFVYTGKLCYAIMDLIKNDFFPEGSNLLLVHSGGLQGNNSLSKGTLIF